MSWLTTVFDWLKDNWGLLLIVAVFALLFLRNKINFSKKKKKEEKTGISIFEDNGLFGAAQPMAYGLQEQKVLAEKWISYLTNQGQQLLKAEKEFEEYCIKKRIELVNERNVLGTKYLSWTNQLKLIDTMIENQKKIQEQAKVR